MDERYIAGIGSRETPLKILTLMTLLGKYLAEQGYILRSGGAKGADSAFESGYKAVNGKMEIFTAKDATPESIKLAMEVHPAPDRCNPYVKKLHGRNSQIILGRKLDKPVSKVYCWTKDGKASGGTGLGIRLAERENIVIKNLYYPKVRREIMEMLGIDTIPEIRTNSYVSV